MLVLNFSTDKIPHTWDSKHNIEEKKTQTCLRIGLIK